MSLEHLTYNSVSIGRAYTAIPGSASFWLSAIVFWVLPPVSMMQYLKVCQKEIVARKSPGFDPSHATGSCLYIQYRRLDRLPMLSPLWRCSSRSLRETSLEVVLMEILRLSFPGHNDQAVQCNTSRQTSVLAGVNVSLLSKLWLCCRQTGRIDAVLRPLNCVDAFADLAQMGMLQNSVKKLTNCLPVLNTKSIASSHLPEQLPLNDEQWQLHEQIVRGAIEVQQ